MTRGEPIKIRCWKEKFGNCFVIDIFGSASEKMMHAHHLFQLKKDEEKKRPGNNVAQIVA